MPLRARSISSEDHSQDIIFIMNREFQVIGAKLDETNAQVQSLCAKLDETTRQLEVLKAKVDDGNKEIKTMGSKSFEYRKELPSVTDGRQQGLDEAQLCENRWMNLEAAVKHYNTNYDWEQVMAVLLAELDKDQNRNSPSYQQLQHITGPNSLHNIACQDCVELLRILLDAGLNVNISMTAFRIGGEPFKGRTMLHSAAEAGCVRVAQLLLDRGADIGAADSFGNTPLIIATKSGKLRMVKWLLDHGADVNSIDDSGKTPLHWAVWYKQISVVRYLVQAGADTSVTNIDGLTAYDICVDIAVKEYLSQHPH